MLSKHKAKHAVAERKQLAKFGAASQWPNSFDDGLTSLGEEVFLKLAVNKVEEMECEGIDVKFVHSLPIACLCFRVQTLSQCTRALARSSFLCARNVINHASLYLEP